MEKKEEKQMKKDKAKRNRHFIENMPAGYRADIHELMKKYRCDFFNAEGVLKDRILERGGI